MWVGKQLHMVGYPLEIFDDLVIEPAYNVSVYPRTRAWISSCGRVHPAVQIRDPAVCYWNIITYIVAHASISHNAALCCK